MEERKGGRAGRDGEVRGGREERVEDGWRQSLASRIDSGLVGKASAVSLVGWLVGWLMGQAKLEAEAAAAATRLSSLLCLRLPARITVLDGGGRASQRKPTQANATRLGTRISLGLLTASANRSDPSVRFANFFSLPILSRVDWPTFFFFFGASLPCRLK